MNIFNRFFHSIRIRLMFLFAVMLIAFTLILSLLYNTLHRRETIELYSQTMQRHAYSIAQSMSEMIAPSKYNSLDETRFIVSEDNLAPYLALTESLTNCNVYLIDTGHNVTGYFDGVVQTLENRLLPTYLEQAVALGFMGKTPFIQATLNDETHLTTCMPVMNAESRVLGVVLLETTLRELGFAQVASGTILTYSLFISFGLAVILALWLSRGFTRPISAVEKVAVALTEGDYDARTRITQKDEIGSLAQSMDILAQRLEESRRLDEGMRKQQQLLFSNISHELRTPVTVMRGSLEALRDGVVTKPEEVNAYYDQMIRETQWLQRLIGDLLELSRLQNSEYSLDMTELNLCDLLGDVAMSARALCENKGVVFYCEEPAADYRIMGDYTRLRQMLLAVADNAVKFTQPGCAVRIWMDDTSPTIFIADEGIGIAQEELSHIFDRFHATHDPAYKGTGLGLAIVKEIARRHQVNVQVESGIGSGTTFVFHFPAPAQSEG